MNFEEIIQWLKDKGIQFWDWLKGHLQTFWSWFKRLWKKYNTSQIIVLALLVLAIISTAYFYIGAKMTDVDYLKTNLEQVTTVVDREGNQAGTLYGEKGTAITLEEMSPYIPQAVISSEDQRFYDHIGFDPIGIGRALFGIIRSGRIVGGGSTLTQQLAKNAYLSADQTLLRKLKELFIAFEIEKTYEKDEILEMYLNTVYFGQGVWGVQDASLKYFGKPASDLYLSEAATLAGILTAPSAYNPYEDPEAAMNRRNTVLTLMEDQAYISAEDRDAAMAAPFNLADAHQSNQDYRYPYYFDAIIEEAAKVYGINEEDLLNNGYTIYTHLDQNQQSQMDSVYQEDQLFPVAADGTPSQSASLAMNPQTGGVTALVGGRGEHAFRGFNRATQMRRQPASLIKPLTVYAPALEEGYSYDSVLPDREISYGEEGYVPYNWNNSFDPDGEVYLYEALAQSLNAPTVWLLNEIGLNTSIRYADRFGLTVNEGDKNLASLALGGMEGGASLMELASAYSSFPNGGMRHDAHLIRKIVNSRGDVVVDNSEPKAKRVISEETATEMNAILMEVFGPNGNSYSYAPSYRVAGKSGTTESYYETGYANDSWLVGYTPDVVIIGWLGYDESSEEHVLQYGESVGPIVQRELERVIPYTAQSNFETPQASELKEEDRSIIEKVIDFFNIDSIQIDWQRLEEDVSSFFSNLGQAFDTMREQLGN